jgi:hypothetical protein
MRRYNSRVRALLITAALLCAACAAGGAPSHEPFADIPVPAGWRPQTRESVVIQSPKVTAGKIVYFAESNVDSTLGEARSLLRGAGWTETKSERFVNPEKFPGAWAEFSKGHDYCRITVTEGTGLQQVDITVARLNGAS